MVGFTHPDMGQIGAWLDRKAGTPIDRTVTLRYHSNAGEANNFTSVDLLQRPTGAGDAWFAAEDFTLAGRTWQVRTFDVSSSPVKEGQIEYLQLQVTVHTLPNRADTDADGLNDAEEMNLGSDGFATDPWKAMCTPMPSATISSRPDGRRGGRPSSQTRAASTWLPWSAQKGTS